MRTWTLLGIVILLSGCATTRLDTEWKSPEAARSLKGGTVFVLCGAPDEALRRVCEDVFAKELAGRGAKPVRAYETAGLTPAANPAEIGAAAKRAGAALVVSTRLSAGNTVVGSSGPSVGVGVGGGGGGVSFGGFGISFPIGGTTVTPSLVGSTSLVDADSNGIAWTATATDTGAQDAPAKLSALAQVLVDSLARAGFL